MRGQQDPKVEIQSSDLIQGSCTPEGTQRFKDRAVSFGIPAKNFRKTYPVPNDHKQIQFDLSTVGHGTFIGRPDDEDDFDNYIAAKYLIRSGAINLIDTAINYRCQ